MALRQFRARALPDDWVELTHDGIDGTHRVRPSAVEHWEDRGWRPANTDPASTDEAGVTGAAAEAAEAGVAPAQDTAEMNRQTRTGRARPAADGTEN